LSVQTPDQSSRNNWDCRSLGIVIPTRNAASDWAKLSGGLRRQGIPPSQVLVIDSDSDDPTRELAVAEGYSVHRINRSDFNHGGTRQLGVKLLPWARLVVFLTQDAVLADADSVSRLVAAFDDPAVAAAYGRQLPRQNSGPIERHARLFNYPDRSELRSFECHKVLGIKAAFLSNSFSAFRVDALCAVGGFPSDVIMAEDTLTAGKLLLAGWKVAYVSEATVIHSHRFELLEEFRRYFDTGVYHNREKWLLHHFGKPAGEGRRFVASELRYLATHQMTRIPEAVVRTAFKAAGYQLGLREEFLGSRWSRKLSLHKGYWDQAIR
jgi:rhamnosyltransferase